jgi:DNA topoisomerase-2
MTKSIDQYKVLDEIEHIRKRTGMYAGSTALEQHEEMIFNEATSKMEVTSLKFVPAFIKIFSEILDNSIDEHRRAPDKLDTIKVDVNADGSISVQDNGRGIPVKIHPQTGKYIAETVFSNLRAGSNFNDDEDQQLIGTNGVGSTLTNVLSTEFKIESSDGEEVFKQTFKDGMRTRLEPSVMPSDKNYTKITFTPDYEFFKLAGMDDDHKAKIFRRVLDAAACNQKVKFYFNGKRVPVQTFLDYAKLYVDNVLYEASDSWQVAIGKSSNGFMFNAFVNSVETYMGGTHIDYVVDPLIEAVRAHVKKKHKIEVRPSDVKSKLHVFINANINRPKFSNQTKERMISPASEYKTAWVPSEKLIKALLKSEIIESIVIWAEMRQKATEEEERRKAGKDIDKTNPKRILKLEDASQAGKQPKLCYLFVAEGDSAAKAIVSGRNPKTMGALALRGKPQNANSVTVDKLLGIDKGTTIDPKKKEQTEFVNIMVAMGLQIGVKVKTIDELRYAHLVVTADADHDGHHISGLMVSNMAKFWPELFELGVIHRFFTPVIKIWLKGKKQPPIAFETEKEYEAWVTVPGNAEKVRDFKYYKGLGTSTPEDFKGYLTNINDHLVKITLDEALEMGLINLVFGKEDGSSDLRKQWLDISEDPIII